MKKLVVLALAVVAIALLFLVAGPRLDTAMSPAAALQPSSPAALKKQEPELEFDRASPEEKAAEVMAKRDAPAKAPPRSPALGALSAPSGSVGYAARLVGADDEFNKAVGTKGAGGESPPTAAPSRSWFPETFLFEPLIVTDDQGRAQVPVRVPDRLTSWRCWPWRTRGPEAKPAR